MSLLFCTRFLRSGLYRHTIAQSGFGIRLENERFVVIQMKFLLAKRVEFGLWGILLRAGGISRKKKNGQQT